MLSLKYTLKERGGIAIITQQEEEFLRSKQRCPALCRRSTSKCMACQDETMAFTRSNTSRLDYGRDRIGGISKEQEARRHHNLYNISSAPSCVFCHDHNVQQVGCYNQIYPHSSTSQRTTHLNKADKSTLGLAARRLKTSNIDASGAEGVVAPCEPS